MTNRLANETSPYLLQHANNPVDWFPWGDEALNKASQENKPIFLSIGYAACHWCHVMEHESFEDPEVARLLNNHFVSIKVDREERPDLDSIYMGAVTAMTGQGGWPMSVFLTPEGHPFYGGTYFPPVRRYGMPSFKEVLNSIILGWKEGRGEMYRVADRLATHLKENAGWALASGGAISLEQIQAATDEMLQSYNAQAHGWGQAPLFPQPMSIEFLLMRASRGDAPKALETALETLDAMSRGGLYDAVGGGFHRYSTDAAWLVPHFEKMLYDNAQLALVYLHAYQMTGQESYRQVTTETLDFILRELSDPAGGFYSSLDADSEGEEGKFYLWTEDEIRAAVGDESDFELLRDVYGLTAKGNFEERTVLQRKFGRLEQAASQVGVAEPELRERLNRLHRNLLEARAARVRPATDDKVLTAWNALALSAFAEAGRALKREDYLDAARKNAGFILDRLRVEGRLLRAWRKGQARHNAYLEDHAALILGLLALYPADPNPRWFATAEELAEEITGAFRAENGGFYNTRSDASGLILRPKDMQDNATPSGNALAAGALLRLSAYNGRGDWRDLAEKMLASIQSAAARYPSAFAFWLQGMDFAAGPVKQVAIITSEGETPPAEMRDYLFQVYRPRVVSAFSSYPPPAGSPELLNDRPLREGSPTAYVCEGFACQMPVTTLEELRELV